MSQRPSRRRPSPRRRPDSGRSREGIGEILELSVGEPAHGGACVARDDSGRVVFVRHAAPGEVVRARVSTCSLFNVSDVLTILPKPVASFDRRPTLAARTVISFND